jgi:hypothetical protein
MYIYIFRPLLQIPKFDYLNIQNILSFNFTLKYD